MAEAEKKSRAEEIAEAYRSGRMFRTLDTVCREAAPIESLWGHFLFRKAITAIIADPGAGKTTLGYNLALSLVQGEPFLDIPPEEPVRCLYFDFESADALVSARKERITEARITNGFYLYNLTDYYITDLTDCIVEQCRHERINLLVVDNQTWAFPTADENDNSEAAKQMRYLKALATETDTSLLLFHHTSKANLPGIRKGSGAFARARLADLIINLDIPDAEGYEKTHIRWTVAKNRMIDFEPVEWYLRKDEGKFELTDAPISALASPNTKIYRVAHEIKAYMSGNGRSYQLSEIVHAMEARGFHDRTIRDAIDRLKRLGQIEQPTFGYYRPRCGQHQQPLPEGEPF